ncbi:MAG: PTS sugar transporter subunit IIA [Planctomycetota bacterium]
MELSELVGPEDVLVEFDPPDKWAAIDQLFDHLVTRGRIPEELASELREAVELRERSMSTGMERGIAIPHAAVDGVEEVVACLGVVQREEGLAFESVDARPAHVVVLLLIPRAQKLLHIRTLADIARLLGRKDVRAALVAAECSEDAWNALRQEGAHHD